MCSALQIFQKEYHPSVYKTGKSGTKEGLSLFGQLSCERGREGEGEDVVGSTINCCFVGIVNRSRSSLGTKLLKLVYTVPFPLIHSLMYSFCRLWFLRPLADIEALRQRQEAVEFLMSPSHEETTMNLHDCSKHIKNIPVREGGERGSVG